MKHSHPRVARRWPTVGLAALSLAFASCGGDPSDERRYGLDETLECPDGYVGWNFATHPPRSLSSQLAADADLLPSRNTLDIGAVRCGADADSTESRQETERVRRACAGDESCSATVACTGEVRVTYNCGETDPDDEGAVLEREVSLAAGDSRALSLSCARAEEEPEVLPERSACVPRYCHGNERRDEALNCVPDATIPSVTLPKVGRATFHPSRFDAGAPDEGTLQMGASYDFDAMLYFLGREASAVPENARATIWLADRFQGPGDVAYAFRCVLTTVDAGRDRVDMERDPMVGSVGVRLQHTGEIPATCYHHADLASEPGVNPAVEADLQRRVGVVRNESDPTRYTASASDDPSGGYAWHSTRIFVSYDMEGDTSAAPLGTDHVCAPNPPAFYWDADDEAFDMVGYLSQRALVRPDTVTSVPFDSIYEMHSMVYPTVIHVGPTDFTLRTASVEVTSLPNRSPSVAVDVGWYRDNDPPANVSPFTFNREGAGLDFEAKLYMWPVDRVGEATAHPEIATIPLSETPATTGSVVSRDLELTAQTRRLFYDPSSALYVDPDVHGNMRAYHVGYCLKSSATASGRLFTPYGERFGESRTRLVSSTGDYRIELRGIDQYNSRTAQSGPIEMYRTRQPTSGCHIATTPLVVHVDRLNRSQLPVGNADFSGQTTNQTSGDQRMSGSSDSDSERACTNADGTPDPTGQSCRETQSGAAMGMGNLGRSFYSYDLDLSRMGQSAQAAMTGNILGFMAIDPMMEGNSSSATPVVGDETTPVTVTLTPPWNTIRDALNRAAGTAPGSVLRAQWQEGSYAGIDGLGLAIGYKQPIQIGPIPGEIILSASAGLALAATITLQAAPSAADAYPCIGSDQCVQVAAAPATLEAAALDCYLRGGRLAEPSTAAEGAALQTATNAGGDDYYWSGAQLAYYHPDPQCLGDGFNTSRCMGAMRTSYRWLSNDGELANGIGNQVLSYTPPSTTSVSQLRTVAPRAAGLLYAPGSQTLATAPATATHPYACAFAPADREIFFRSSVGLKVAAGAGVSLQFCVPSSDVGFCLEGALNFVTIALTPTVTRTDRVLFGGASPLAYRAHTRREVPWALTVLDGGIYAKANFYFASFTWPIVTFPGFRVAEGYLVDPIDTAVHRGL